MRNTTLPVIFGGVAVIVLILVLLFAGGKDKTGPTIEFTDECITVFTDDDDVDVLLKGVKAVDDKDGDVSNTLRIQNITVLKEDSQIVVHYSAKDLDNNIVKKEKSYDYTGTKDYITFSVLDEEIFKDDNASEGSSSQSETESSGMTETESTSEVNDPTSESDIDDATSQTNDSVADNEEETSAIGDNNQVNDTPIDRAEVDANGIPQIRMKYHELKIAAGSDFYFMDALSEWYDDKDDVSRRVIVLGEYDINVPGTYVLTYYVTDSDLNVSNKETLTLIVE